MIQICCLKFHCYGADQKILQRSKLHVTLRVALVLRSHLEAIIAFDFVAVVAKYTILNLNIANFDSTTFTKLNLCGDKDNAQHLINENIDT
jgi:hypothetical protein